TRTNPNDVIAAAARLYFQLPASARTQKQTKIFLDQLAPDSHGNRIIMNTSFGLRMQALAAYLMAAGEEDQSFQLTVKVNDNEVMNKNVSKAVFPYQRIEIDPAFIEKDENRVEFTFSGKGQYRYAAVMEGWTKQEVKPQDWLDRQERIIHHFERDYRHGPLVVAHKEIPRGYSVVEGSVRSVQNELKEVQAGDRVEVRLTLTGDKPMDYLAIEDSIPAGFLLEKNSVHGQADHYSLQGNKLRFYVRGPHKHTYIIYQLRARYPGQYRALPALMSPHGAPEQIYATDAQPITVLPEGETPQTEYNPTPDELYHMGMRYAEIGEEEKAKTYLTQLIDTYNLRPKYYLETARQLFLIHLKGDNWAELVRYFEIIKERDKGFEIQFTHIARLAQAYRNIGEFERAVYVYRSLFDGLYTQESALSGTLQEVNRHREALDTMKQLILEYPDIPSVQNAVYTTGSIIYRNVDQWMQDEAFVEAGYTKKSLLAEAVGMINSFLALYPTNPMADEAGYTLINLWLDQKNHSRVADLAASFAKRYPQSVFLDSFDYLQAYALFQMENYNEALELAKQVSTQEYPAPGGGMRKSEEANTAILMAGKILHAAGRLDEALDEYTRVKESFGDAGKSIAYLQEKGLSMDDLTTFKTRESASITIKHKNLDDIELRIYKVDLMTFYLMERDLENMTGINLAGITPIYKKTFNVKREDRFAWHELDVDLSLSDPGAYLAVAGGNGLMASGMIIRSDLNIEVQEDAQQGMVRVNAYFDEPTNYAKGVKIQVRGSGNSHFLSGETDLRGVFTATGIRGTATVLAQADEQYGFYRGTKSLGQIEQDKQAGQGRQKGVDQQQWGVDALGNNFSRLNQLQERQNERWVQQIDVSNNLKQVQKAQALY
ncbi:tetratricopeptide repeat protein, partial [bacterium]|nr:tetratricopeptide repeat protein [bacterium]